MTQTSLSQYMHDPVNSFWIGVAVGLAGATLAFAWAILKSIHDEKGGY